MSLHVMTFFFCLLFLLSRADYKGDMSDISVLKIFFANYDTFLYKKDVVYMWYDIVSEYRWYHNKFT